MPLKGLGRNFVGWLLVALPHVAFSLDTPSYQSQLLQSVVRMEAVAQSPAIAARLQLLHALTELDLAMEGAANHRLQALRGGLSAQEMAQQLQLFRALFLWQQGNQAGAAALLSSLPSELPAELQQERQLLQALLGYGAGERARAITKLGELRANAPFLSPITLDLALMLAQSGEREYAVTLLQLLGNSKAESDYEEQLRDRANLTLARLLSLQGQGDAAQGALERVRLNGPDGSAALLLLGWMRLELSGSEAALVPWLELALRDENEPAVIEGKLAMAMALAQRAPDSAAYGAFATAEEFYQQRLTQLDARLAAFAGADGELLALQEGGALVHGGSVRAARLAQQHEALLQLQGQWPSSAGQALVDVDELRQELLAALRRTDAALAGQPAAVAWRVSYGKLYRQLEEEFASERVRTGKLAMSRAPFAEEAALLAEAAAALRSEYRQALVVALQLQRQRVTTYLEQCRYATARLHEMALLVQMEER